MVAGLVMGACGGGDPPSCSVAVGHFYGAGCTLVRADGSEIPQSDALAGCRSASSGVPASCVDAFDDFLFALDGVPDHVTTSAQCDLGPELDAIASCEH